ncbi:cyclin-L1-like isoform X1 [Protopterus annectens]|uniref:cyclin-L1-like isoform X1 n=1 Tax=Protopterus annectens TaxID=7888 RepID=UPI001CF9B4F5|nr:cyclin-L1-like isoform X1 [Protopterus annectens]
MAAVPAEGILIGDKMYSSVEITLKNCVIPEERVQFTASMVDGLDLEVETDLRIVGCELIQAAGILLKLPQVAMATSQVLFQRFYYSKSFVKHIMEIVAMACVHLASKIEEAPRRVRDVVNVFHHLRQVRERKKSAPMPLDASYINLKNQVIKAERRVLKELGFCVHVQHPHKIIVMYLQVLECERNQHLVQTSWNYMNDSLRSDVFVRFHPETIACACIYLAARALEIPLPSRPHWFLLFGANEEDIQDVCHRILKLYTRKKADLAYLEKKVEERKMALEEAKAKAKGLLPDGTPALENTAGFSPSSKNETPREAKADRTSPLAAQAVKHARRKLDDGKHSRSASPDTNIQRGSRSRSRSRSRDRSRTRSRSRSQTPKRRSRSHTGSSSSRSRSYSRSRSDSPPRKHSHNSSYSRPKHKNYENSKDYKYGVLNHHRSRSRSRGRSSSRSRSRSRDRSDHMKKYKKESHSYRTRRHHRSHSYERSSSSHGRRDHSGHRRHRR